MSTADLIQGPQHLMILKTVEATSPVAFLGGVGVIALTALAAGFVPALRAARLSR